MTLITCEQLRQAAGIEKVYLPGQLCSDAVYDKWSNEILTNGLRVRGELFDDESVQKILKEANVLHLFTTKVKYARTPHLPWSPGLSNPNERMIESFDAFVGSEVVVTAKMDGENTTLYRNDLHARSLDYSPHSSRSMLKAFWASIAHDIPEGWRVCVENLYAKHSIYYKHLPAWWLGLSVWNDRNMCLPWEETLEWFELLGIKPCPTLYRGIYNDLLKYKSHLYKSELNGDPLEGYVVRLTRGFHYREFRHCVAKYVREGHVQTNEHWSRSQIIANQLEK
jgi:hypothetical protein